MPILHHHRATVRVLAVALVVGTAIPSAATGAADPPAQVLIYYANETAPEGPEAANYETITGWLAAGQHPEHAKVARQLDEDRRLFPAAVDVEEGLILSGLADGDPDTGAVLFTNRLVRSGRCRIVPPGGEPRDVTFPAPADENYILTVNPLSRAETLRDVLAFVAAEFDPARHEFVLIVKSHGNSEKAVTPRLAVRHEETTREELLRVASGEGDDADLPTWVGRLGITKPEFLAALADAGERHGMRFPLVYLEACHAATEAVGPDRLPANVERLMVVKDDVFYINLLYADRLARLGDGRKLSDVLTDDLPAKFAIVSKAGESLAGASSGVMPQWAYFVPLALWMVWVGWHSRLRRGGGA